MKYTLTALTLFVSLSFCYAQKVKPALHLVKGNTYYMSSVANSNIVQTINGKENNISLTLAFTMAFKVTDITDTVFNMEVSYQTMDMKVQVAGQTIEMDSKKNDPKDIPSSVIAAMMNKPFDVALTRSGKINSVQNVEKLISGAFSSFSTLDSSKREQLKTQFMQSFGPTAIKGNLEVGTAIFPDKAVSKNDKWTVNTNIKIPAEGNMLTVYQLTDFNKDEYLIHGDGILSMKKDAKPGMISGMPMKYNLGGTSVSDIKADRKTGWIKSVKIKQTMKGDIQILDNPKVPGGMSIPMTFVTDVTTSNSPPAP